MDQTHTLKGQGLNFTKSSYCGESSHCVEVAITPTGAVVRDSKNPAMGHLVFTNREWQAFVASVRAGEFG